MVVSRNFELVGRMLDCSAPRRPPSFRNIVTTVGALLIELFEVPRGHYSFSIEDHVPETGRHTL